MMAIDLLMTGLDHPVMWYRLADGDDNSGRRSLSGHRPVGGRGAKFANFAYDAIPPPNLQPATRCIKRPAGRNDRESLGCMLAQSAPHQVHDPIGRLLIALNNHDHGTVRIVNVRQSLWIATKPSYGVSVSLSLNRAHYWLDHVHWLDHEGHFENVG
jgi:hypothetical protein